MSLEDQAEVEKGVYASLAENTRARLPENTRTRLLEVQVTHTAQLINAAGHGEPSLAP